MNKFEIIVPVIFGLEAFTAREIRALGYETSSVEDGKVCFYGDMNAVYAANLWLRTGERVLIKAGEFFAETFDELFENTKSIEWHEWIGRENAFPVTGYSIKSKLASVPDCQAIIKKAIAVSMGGAYKLQQFPETGSVYQIRFSILKNKVTLMIDTSGTPLHKRGYRAHSNAAPLKETIAAAMVYMSRWKYESPLCDPFAGSGTIPIEAAMIKRNIAPGLFRSFMFEGFGQFNANEFNQIKNEAVAAQKNIDLEIYANDIDPKCRSLIKENAQKANVSEFIKISSTNAEKLSFSMPGGTIITNPPYGERMSDLKKCELLYKNIGKSFKSLDNWKYFILTSHEGFEKLFGKKADKKRKVYNGMIKCNVYQYFK